MPWGVAIGAAVSLVGSYASSKAQAGAAKDSAKAQAEAQKEITELQRQYQLEDRKYNQDAVGAWGKYLDPALIGSTSASDSGGRSVPSNTPSDSTATSSGKSDKPVTDPDDPMFARNPVAAPANAIPLKYPSASDRLAAIRSQALTTATAPPPASLWFQRQYPDYDPNNPTAIPVKPGR